MTVVFHFKEFGHVVDWRGKAEPGCAWAVLTHCREGGGEWVESAYTRLGRLVDNPNPDAAFEVSEGDQA